MMKALIAAITLAAILSASPIASLANSHVGRATGEVRKIDKEAGKVTLRHDPIEGMGDMPAMTMVFRVSDPAMLDRMKVGDTIRFTVKREDGAMIVQSFEPAK